MMDIVKKELPYFDPIFFVSQIPRDKNFIFFDTALQSNRQTNSFICYDPFSIISSKGGQCFIDDKLTTKLSTSLLSEKLRYFSDLTKESMPFYGGLAGFIGYEFINYLEPNICLSKKDAMDFPDFMLGLFDLIIAFDHHAKRCWIFSSGLPEQDEKKRKIRALKRCEELIEHIMICDNRDVDTPVYIKSEDIIANVSFDEYCSNINKVLDYIQAGDIYQANISQRFTCRLPSNLSPMSLYQRLRVENPAPYSAYLNFNGYIIASASPERFINTDKNIVTTCPIKGTARRDNNMTQDKLLAENLSKCEKNRAENLMIVDLMRNDLSKVSDLFTVTVPSLFAIESYASVHHLVSTIQSKLRKEFDLIDLLVATFPGGSITGAPKLRAIEIIDEIEKDKRGPYCGSIGYFGPHGNMDSSILIRTFVIKNDYLSFHVGGGIVADSKPEDEYLETLTKAKALLAALTGNSK